MNNWKVILIIALIAGLLGFGLVVYLLPRQSESPAQTQPPVQTASRPTPQTTVTETQSARPATTDRGDDSILEQLFGPEQAQATGQVREESWTVIILKVLFRLLLAALLATFLTRRPRQRVSVQHLTPPYVAQTQILLAVVASALMMIVGDSAARAFGIFAAASLVRFRTNIRDPKEITILLISLAIGLATGVGRWELAVILTLFMLPLLWFLEHNETTRVRRTMELKVATKDTDETQDVLQNVFKKHNFSAEIRALSRADDAFPTGNLVYHVSMNLSVSTDQLSEEILSSDQDKITSIEWQQQKSNFY